MSQTEMNDGGRHPAVVLLHGAGGAIGYWAQRFAPAITRFGVGLYAPSYFDRTGTERATRAMILDGEHFPDWLASVEDAVEHVASRPPVDPGRIALIGISLGGYLAMASATVSRRLRAVVELSGGMPPGYESRIMPSMPPVLVLHGGQDTVVPVSEAHRLERLLQTAGVTHQAEIFPAETHWFSEGAQARMLMTCAGFLGRHLLGSGATSPRELTSLPERPS